MGDPQVGRAGTALEQRGVPAGADNDHDHAHDHDRRTPVRDALVAGAEKR